jgi:flavin reductase (DIM6/NTAB) family NADH-FMN oxidoreductase RutF
MADDGIDPRAFRDVAGQFATGVTVVTAVYGRNVRGMTANAFTSVSLSPPLVLVCIDHNASMHPWFEAASAFAVNILSEDQQEISRYFAKHSDHGDPMGGIPHRPGDLGSPIIEGALAWMECEVEQRYDGGDHTIVVGRVRAMDTPSPDGAPLLFFRGQYRALGEPLQ